MPKSRAERASVKAVRGQISRLRRDLNNYITKREGLLAQRDDLNRRINQLGGRRGRGRPAAGTPAKSKELTDLEKALTVVNKGLDYYGKVQTSTLNKIHELEQRILARPRPG